MIVLRTAVLTPFGDLGATLTAIANRTGSGVRDPETGLVTARLTAKPAAMRHARLVGPMPALALDVARSVASDLPRGSRTGVFVATGGLRAHWDELAPAMAEQVQDGALAWARGLSRMHPLWMLRYLSNAAHAIIAAELGALGDGATFAGAASAASALVAAQAAFDAETIDHAIVVALDDVTADEVAIELASRNSRIVAGAGVAALVLARDPAAEARLHVVAVDGVDPEHAEPSAAAIAAVRNRLPKSSSAAPAREVSFAMHTGWLGAASLLADAIVAGELMLRGWPAHLDLGAPLAVTVTAAASPGQIGVLRVEAGARGARLDADLERAASARAT
ncbi:MAG: 3-oxoacyl-[acyl-carrier-protein] synthase [Myxococcales bacterium]|nr:3-oxoacyl-[acyl-carrier-protein] synthase [Myxococcales bacterium]